MSRSGYSDDLDPLQMGQWRGQVASAMRGRRGQAFLRELLAAMDAMPDKRLIAHELQTADGEVCAIGCVGRARGMDMTGINPEDNYEIAASFNIANAMACELMFMNDEWFVTDDEYETPEDRFARMRSWIAGKLVAGK